MDSGAAIGLPTILAIAGGAAFASVAGGLISLWHRPSTAFMSVALGFASGVLLATIAFEMLPSARDFASLWIAIGGFASGFFAVYVFDLYLHRGVVAGEHAEQRPQVERFWRRCRPRGGEITVLAGGTSAEELIEGLSIGVGAAIEPGLAVVIGLAIAVDNLSEGLSIGEIIRGTDDNGGKDAARRILGWTSVIGVAVLGSAIAGWFFLRGLPHGVLGFLIALGGGGMFYLTVTDLIPQAEEHHYQQSSALAMATGFLVIFLLAGIA